MNTKQQKNDIVFYKPNELIAVIGSQDINRTARHFGVSFKAARVQMTKYGLQADPNGDAVREARRRLKMYRSLWR